MRGTGRKLGLKYVRPNDVYSLLGSSKRLWAVGILWLFVLGLLGNAFAAYLHALLAAPERHEDRAGWLYLAGICVAVLLTLFLMAWLLVSRRTGQRTTIDEINPRKVLVWSLSTYEPRGALPKAVLAKQKGDKILTGALGSNWEPLCRAVKLHLDQLERVYLVCTPRAEGDFPEAEKIIHSIAGDKVVVYEEVVASVLNVEDAQELVERIYRQLLRHQYAEGEMITDITGGSRAVILGLALGTLDRGRDVQYYDPEARDFRFVTTSPDLIARFSG